MNFCVNPYLDRTFNDRKYNCYDFVREVWKDITGIDLGAQTPDVKSVTTYTDRSFLVASSLQELLSVQDPCIVLLLRKRMIPHIGIYVQGKVLHLSKNGPHYVPLSSAAASFTTVKFYK